ncbi:MAG: SANT/Myb domain-containing protein [Puniceicoccales bacterium]|nr:SANT/Myb domain-containing protein [Puniceicoccales bacterium]
MKIKYILSPLLYLSCIQYSIHGSATPTEDEILRDVCYRICGHEALHCLLPENNPNPELLENLSDTYNQYVVTYNAKNGTELPKQTAKVLQERFVEQFSKFKPNNPSCPTDKYLNSQLAHWTPEEDQCLREIIAERKSPNWSQITPLFHQKSSMQIRNRYYQLKNNPNDAKLQPLFLYIPN